MQGQGSRDTSQVTNRGESRVRHDPTGEIARSLAGLIERGSAITYELHELAYGHPINGQAKTIESWRAACVETLHAAFTRETALEFLHASDPATRRERHSPSIVAHIQRMQDALALLAELKRTLEPRGRVATCKDAGELRGSPRAAATLERERFAAPQH